MYGEVRELLPPDAPKPLGKPVVTTSYVDANLYHDLITDQIIDLRTSLRYLGVPLLKQSKTFLSDDSRDTPSYLFGDNKSAITSATIPHSSLNKRHNALSYHKVREAVAAKILAFVHIDGKAIHLMC